MAEIITKNVIQSVISDIGGEAKGTGAIYLIGGASAVWNGWRTSTRDIDMAMAPEPTGLFGAINHLKRRLNVDIEIVDPNGFVPALPGWQGRSEFIGRFGSVDFYLYDYYGQALMKIDRYHDRDITDVEGMIADKLINSTQMARLCALVDESSYGRFPTLKWGDLVRKAVSLVRSRE